MIVTIAAGGTAQRVASNPLEAHADDDRLHRRSRLGRPARRTRSTTRRSSPSARLLFVVHLRRSTCSASGWSAGSGRCTSERSIAPRHRIGGPSGRVRASTAAASRSAFRLVPAARACVIALRLPRALLSSTSSTRAGPGSTLDLLRRHAHRRCSSLDAGVQSAIIGTLWVISSPPLLPADRHPRRRSTSRSTPTTPAGTTGCIELNIQNLAGVPSIVYGILGLGLIARVLGLGLHRPQRRDHPVPAGPARS